MDDGRLWRLGVRPGRTVEGEPAAFGASFQPKKVEENKTLRFSPELSGCSAFFLRCTCTCVSASARQSRAQCRAREFCCKILFARSPFGSRICVVRERDQRVVFVEFFLRYDLTSKRLN